MVRTVTLSDCCDAEVRERETEDDVIAECMECGRPCTTREVCELCYGTGRIEGTDEDGYPSGKFTKCQECVDGHDPDDNN